jgi:hypothetical protein
MATCWQTTSFAIGEDLNLSAELQIASGVTPANSDTLTPGKPAIGFDGTNYLVVSCRENDSPTGIFGVLLSATGTVLTSFPIADFNPVFVCQNRPSSVAFDGNNNLIVFSQVTETGSSAIVGLRVSPSGTMLDGAEGFTILPDVSGSAVVAFDGSNYLVASIRFSGDTLHDVVGARVSPAGQVLDEFSIFTAPGGQVFPAIAFDGTNYLVIWSDTRSGGAVGPDADIYGTRVSPAGIVMDPQGIPISTAVGIQDWPQLVFDGQDYFAVWEDTRSDPDGFLFPPPLDIFGTRITPDGAVLDGPPETGGIAINTHPLPKQHPTVSWDGAEYFVAWEVSFFYDPPVGIYAARISTDGLLVDGPPDAEGILISQPDCFACRLVWPNSLFSGDNLLLAWINNTELSDTFKDVVGVLIGPSAGAPGVEIDIDIKPGNPRNVINPRSHGGIWVALLSDSEFDPLQIDIPTVRLGPTEAAVKRHWVQDLNRDGLSDFLMRFKVRETGIECGDTEATLTGDTFSGQRITGMDSIATVGCKYRHRD